MLSSWLHADAPSFECRHLKNKMTSIFLSKEDVATLTGAQFKTKQIEQLKRMRLPFWINAQCVPVVPRSAIDGWPEEKSTPAKPVWVMPRGEPRSSSAGASKELKAKKP